MTKQSAVVKVNQLALCTAISLHKNQFFSQLPTLLEDHISYSAAVTLPNKSNIKYVNKKHLENFINKF